MTMNSVDDLQRRIIAALRAIRDPEIPVNIFDLGLIYQLDVTPTGDVHVRMTLTSPNCPVAEALPGRVAQAIRALDGVRAATVELVWEPPWSRDRMTEAARLELGMNDAPPGRPFVPADSLVNRRR